MLRALLLGAAAGAVGTVALDVTSYADMLVRGRAPSQMPAQLADKLAKAVGISLANDGDERKAENRKAALGALLGYGVGVGVGAGYGVVRALAEDVPLPVASGGLGAAAMAMADVPLVALGLTNPTDWGLGGWLADIIPHLAYGTATAVTYEALNC
jgi:hypothetical protein